MRAASPTGAVSACSSIRRSLARTRTYAVYPRDEAATPRCCPRSAPTCCSRRSVDEMYPAGRADPRLGRRRSATCSRASTGPASSPASPRSSASCCCRRCRMSPCSARRTTSSSWSSAAWCADLCIPTRIESVPTVREADGLALSSRNAYLSAEERRIAPALYRTLQRGRSGRLVRRRRGRTRRVGRGRAAARRLHAVDYVTVRDAQTLAPWQDRTRPGRVLAAARLGNTRLIDNVPLG